MYYKVVAILRGYLGTGFRGGLAWWGEGYAPVCFHAVLGVFLGCFFVNFNSLLLKVGCPLNFNGLLPKVRTPSTIFNGLLLLLVMCDVPCLWG